MMNMPKRRPGDLILDHYVPHLSPEDREIARERLADFAELLSDMAVGTAGQAMHSSDSPGGQTEDRIPEFPTADS